MRYFLFEAASECLTYSPTSGDGVPLREAPGYCRLSSVERGYVRLMRKPDSGFLPDRLSVGVSLMIVLHAAAVEILATQLRLPDDLLRLPITVLNQKGKELSSDYVLLHSSTEYDVLDRERSVCRMVINHEQREIIYSVQEWCIRRTELPDLDAFPVKPNDWIVSEAFKYAYETNGFTGCKFTDVQVT